MLAALALLALVGGIVSDPLAEGFRTSNPLLAALVASVIVVMLTVARLAASVLTPIGDTERSAPCQRLPDGSGTTRVGSPVVGEQSKADAARS